MTTNGRATTNGRPIAPTARNVLGGPLAVCGTDPLTGFYRWCLCADRWQEALEAGVAPPVVLAATHEAALEIVRREDLLRHAVDLAGGAL